VTAAPLVVHLLGAPRVVRDGDEQRAPRGHKAWGLLTYLLLAPVPVPRRRLCALLFADAEDPLAVLRWNLSALRSLLGDPEALKGDPVRVGLPAVVVDVRVLRCGSWADVEALGGVDGELLEDLSFASSPSFDVWLEAERRHVRGATASLIREASVAALAGGDAATAAGLADRLVRLEMHDEAAHALLVRALAAAGDGVAAARQAAASRDLLRRELGSEPGPALDAAAATVTSTPVAAARGGRALSSRWSRRDARRSVPEPSTRVCSACAVPSSTRRRSPTPG
jgi:DNA-binding SARP family transcriptional activator